VRYRPALDGVRGIAILLVLGKHAFGWPKQGGLGVDLFFVLSGFLITSLLLEERREHGRVSLRHFFWRRALRLFPALFAMLLAYAAVKAAQGELPDAAGPLALGATYTANIALAGDISAMPEALRHLWSLAQEEQFYLVWPPLLVFGLTFHRSRLLPHFVIAAIIVVALERARLGGAGASLDRVYFAPDTHAEPLLVGCLFGIWNVNGLPALLRPDRQRRVLALLAAALYLGAAVFLHDLWLAVYVTPLFTVLAGAAAVVVISAAHDDYGIARVLRARPLVGLGRISYGLYLWHVPVLAALGAAALGRGLPISIGATIGAVAIAVLSHRYVEAPFLRMKSRARSTVAPIPAPAPAV
jgi:peptidoglycan/LPS O-acetylase OafA/YrhL